MSTRDYDPEAWLRALEEGFEYRRKFGLEDKWAEFEAIYYNTHKSMMNDGPNMFLSTGDTLLSTLTVPSARVRVEPTTAEEVSKAPMLESMDNKLVREMGLVAEVERAAHHAYLFGRGFIKIGYDSEFGYSPEHDMGGVLQLGATLTQLNESGTRRIEYDSGVIPGSPWVRAVMPHDIVAPWGSLDVDSCPWLAHRVVRHIDDLRADPKYSVPRSLQPTLSMEDFVNSYGTVQAKRLSHSHMRSSLGKSSMSEPEYVEFFEIHDRCTGRIYVVTWDCDKFLRNENNALQIENKLPFAGVGFTPRTRSFWTTPDVYYLYYIQCELSDTAVQRTKQRRLSTLKFLYDEGLIDEEELLKVLSPEVGAAAKCNAGGDLAKVIQQINFTPNPLLAQEEELLRANAREQIGFSRNQLGEYVGGRRTASEAQIVDRSSQLRMSRRGLQIKRLYEDVIRITNNILFTYWTLPRYVELLGEQGAKKWQMVNGPSLRGRYNYNIEMTDDEELQRRKLGALQLYAQLSLDPTVDPVGLREWLTAQVNDPAFERIFSADVRRRMLELAVLNGALGNIQQATSGTGRGGGGGGVQALPGANGEVPNPTANAARLLAPGRNGTGAYS